MENNKKQNLEKELNELPNISSRSPWIVTGVLVALVLVYIWFQWTRFSELDPNEVGDFIAGIAGSIALIWLVFTFRQQQTQIQQNSISLRIQALELEELVNETAKQTSTMKQEIQLAQKRFDHESEQIEMKEKANFIFSLGNRSGGPTGINFCVKIKNQRGVVLKIKLIVLYEEKLICKQQIAELSDGNKELKLLIPKDKNTNFNDDFTFDIHIKYEGLDSKIRFESHKLFLPKNGLLESEKKPNNEIDDQTFESYLE